MKVVTTAAAMAFALGAASALAAAPQPAKPVAPTLFSGRWYEIARTQNKMQDGCQASTSDFSDWTPNGGFSVTQTCRKGAPDGPRQVMRVSGRVLPASANAKMKLGLLGGLISQEYWIIDHADNNAWAIMDRADGRYVWLLSREPMLNAADRAVALARLKALGFDLSHIGFVQQAR